MFISGYKLTMGFEIKMIEEKFQENPEKCHIKLSYARVSDQNTTWTPLSSTLWNTAAGNLRSHSSMFLTSFCRLGGH
jgi:hypothetical protein